MRGCFVTAVDTGVGKTVVAAAIAAGLRAQGVRVAACKPVVTGLDDDETVPGVPFDHVLLARCTGQSPQDVTPVTFGPAVSPHLAAALVGTPLASEALVAHARGVGASAEAVVVEGVGGLLVPLSERYLVRDFAVELGLPVVVVARPGLGTINHTLLTVEAARAVGLHVAAIVLNPWPDAPTTMEADNRRTIAGLTGVRVHTLARLPELTVDGLTTAGSTWPLLDWLSPPGA